MHSVGFTVHFGMIFCGLPLVGKNKGTIGESGLLNIETSLKIYYFLFK